MRMILRRLLCCRAVLCFYDHMIWYDDIVYEVVGINDHPSWYGIIIDGDPDCNVTFLLIFF